MRRSVPAALFAGVIVAGLWVSAASATASLMVNPNTNLADGQTVVGSGSGFPANTQIGTVECHVSDCDASTNVFVTTDGLGSFSLARTVQRHIVAGGISI